MFDTCMYTVQTSKATRNSTPAHKNYSSVVQFLLGCLRYKVANQPTRRTEHIEEIKWATVTLCLGLAIAFENKPENATTP